MCANLWRLFVCHTPTESQSHHHFVPVIVISHVTPLCVCVFMCVWQILRQGSSWSPNAALKPCRHGLPLIPPTHTKWRERNSAACHDCSGVIWHSQTTVVVKLDSKQSMSCFIITSVAQRAGETSMIVVELSVFLSILTCFICRCTIALQQS